jgi:hypothetical protein
MTLPDDTTARLARADEKLVAARKIAEIDAEIAYVTAYDATRIAITAHLLSIGLRVRESRPRTRRSASTPRR